MRVVYGIPREDAFLFEDATFESLSVHMWNPDRIIHAEPFLPISSGKIQSAHTKLFGTRWLMGPSRYSVIVAHPNDEVIAAGGLISQLENVTILHVTDGAPGGQGVAEAAGFSRPSEYARARREECISALALANVPEDRILEFGFSDHNAPHAIADLTRRIAGFLQQSSPDIVLTHPYEGGHPDHDATAFATHAALKLLERNGLTAPVVFEMALHPGADGDKRVLDFLPGAGREITTLMLDRRARELKRRMIDYFDTQGEVLKNSPIGPERFRKPPIYDFTMAPQGGEASYEKLNLGITADQWQILARQAWTDLFPDDAAMH